MTFLLAFVVKLQVIGTCDPKEIINEEMTFSGFEFKKTAVRDMTVNYLLIPLLLLSCAAPATREIPQATAPKEPGKISSFEKVYVSSVEIDRVTSTGNTVVFRISGNLPNPAYELDVVEVEVDGTTITLTPIALFNPNIMAVQVLTPFTTTATVKIPAQGEYTVVVEGRGDRVKKTMTLP